MIKYKARVKVISPLGLHARPGVSIVKCAQTFRPTELELRCLSHNTRALGHSLLSILSLGAGKDSEIELICRGPRADELLKAMKVLFETNFAEPEEVNESEHAKDAAWGDCITRARGG